MKNLLLSSIFTKSFGFVASLILFGFISLSAQTSTTISDVEISDVVEGESLTFTASLLQPEITSSVTLAYKPFVESEFTFVEMEVIANTATYTINADEIKIPSVSYYLEVRLTTGVVETYPVNVPDGNQPVELPVSSKSEKEKEIIILSPAAGETVSKDDFFISVSFIKAPEIVDVSATKIYLGTQDITEYILFAGDLLIFYSNNFPDVVGSGGQSIRIETFDKEGNEYYSSTRNFTTKSAELIELEADALTYSGNFKLESRNESFNTESEWFNNLTVDLNSKYSDWKFRGYAYLTSEEKSDAQPRHRFFASAESDWLKLRVGDAYPKYPQLIMNGKRVRGVSGGLELGFFNIQSSYGQVKRSVEGELLGTYDAETVPLESNVNVISIDKAKYGNPYGEINAGTYQRDIFVLRPSFGSGEYFKWGFTYLHSKDDMNSVEFAKAPEENVVAGTDMRINLDNRNIIIKGSAAVSLINSDISPGELTDSQIDTIFGGEDSFIDVDPKTIKDIKSYLGKFITVNQNIGPLNPQELSSLGAEGSVQLNYFNNSLKTSYVFRGNEYSSFGQDFVRTDVKGINIADRIRFWDNRLFLTLGYEKLEDNLQKTKQATTEYETFNAAVSIFPRMNFPNITVTFTRNDNKNDIDPLDEEKSIYLVDYSTNRVSSNISYGFTAGVKHNSSLNFTTSSTEDNGATGIDANFLSTSFSFNSYWNRDLTSFFSLIHYNSEISQVKYNYTTVAVGGRYRMLQDKLELKATLRPTFGDLEQQVLDLLANYMFIENLYAGLQIRIFRKPGISTDSITGLTLRYNI